FEVTPDTKEVAGKRIGRVGASPRDLDKFYMQVSYGPGVSLIRALEKTADIAIFSLRMLGKMLLGEVSWRNLSGPVTIADFAGQSFKPFVVKDIRAEGLQRTEPGTVFSYLPVKVGETMNEEKAQQALRALYATGFFTDVRLEVENDVLVVYVQERPAIAQIDFSGIKEFENEQLRKALRELGMAEARIFDRSMLDLAEQEIKRQYLSHGYYAAAVQTTVTPL